MRRSCDILGHLDFSRLFVALVLTQQSSLQPAEPGGSVNSSADADVTVLHTFN